MDEKPGEGVRKSARIMAKRALERAAGNGNDSEEEEPEKTAKNKPKLLRIDDLPDDMLCEIFDRLQPDTALKIRTVNKTWRRCIEKSLAKRVSAVQVVRFCSEVPSDIGRHFDTPLCNHTTITVRAYDRVPRNFHHLIARLDNVKCLDVNDGHLVVRSCDGRIISSQQRPGLEDLIGACSGIEKLFVQVNHQFLTLLSGALRNRLANQLKVLAIHFCDALPPNPKVVDFLADFLAECKQLERFFLNTNHIYEHFTPILVKINPSVFVFLDVEPFTEAIAKRIDQLYTSFSCLASVKKFDRLSVLKLFFDEEEEFEHVIEVPELKRLDMREIFDDSEEPYEGNASNNNLLFLIQQHFGEMKKLDELNIRYFYHLEKDEQFMAVLAKMPNLSKLVVNNEITFYDDIYNKTYPRRALIPAKSLERVEKLRVLEMRRMKVNKYVANNLIKMFPVLETMPQLRTVLFELIIDTPDNNVKKLFAALVTLAEKKPLIGVEIEFWVKLKKNWYVDCKHMKKNKELAKKRLRETKKVVEKSKFGNNLKVSFAIIKFNEEDKDEEDRRDEDTFVYHIYADQYDKI